MRLTSPQLRALSEAGISRRDFLKYVGKAAGVSQLGPFEKLGGLLGKGVVSSKGIPVKIELFKIIERPFKKLSDELNFIQGAFGFFKNLVGKVHDRYDYSQYWYESVANVDLNDLIKKWGLKHFGSEGVVDHPAARGVNRLHGPVDEGIWYVDTPYGTIQVTDLKQNAKANDLDEINDFVGDLVEDPVKDFWEEVGRDMFFNKPEFFDKDGLEELKSRGFNPEETVKHSKEFLERNRQSERDGRNRQLENQEQEEEEQARLRELGDELDYIRAIDEALGIRK